MIDAICRSLLTVNISSRYDSYAPDDTSFVYVRILPGDEGFHLVAFHDNSWIESKQRCCVEEQLVENWSCLFGIDVDLGVSDSSNKF